MNIQHKHTTKSNRILNFTLNNFEQRNNLWNFTSEIQKVEIGKTIKTLPYFYVPIWLNWNAGFEY